MDEINRIEDLTRVGQDSQVLEPLGPSGVSDHQPEATEPATVESDPLPDLPDSEDIELSNWRASVEAYVATQTQPFTVDDVLEHGLHFTPGGWDRSEQMRVAAILREFGFDRQQRRIEGVRAQYWSSPTMVAFAAPEPAQPATVAVRVAQHAEPAATAEAVPPLAPQEGGSVIGNAVDDVTPEPVAPAPVEPAQPPEPRESASARHQQLSARQTEIKSKLRAAKDALGAAEQARKKAALAAVGGSFTEEAQYYAAVEKHTQAGAHVEQLTEALTQIGEDLRHASVEQEAERRVAHCRQVREAARLVEPMGPKIEGLLAELGKVINAYLHNVNHIYRRAIPSLSGQPECAMPMTEPVAHAILGCFLRHARLDPNFFSDMNMNSLLAFESPSQIVSMQLDAIVARLFDNSWMALADTGANFMAEPETYDHDRECIVPLATRAVRVPFGHVGHELVPEGIFPTSRPADAEGDDA